MKEDIRHSDPESKEWKLFVLSLEGVIERFSRSTIYLLICLETRALSDAREQESDAIRQRLSFARALWAIKMRKASFAALVEQYGDQTHLWHWIVAVRHTQRMGPQ